MKQLIKSEFIDPKIQEIYDEIKSLRNFHVNIKTERNEGSYVAFTTVLILLENNFAHRISFNNGVEAFDFDGNPIELK